MHKQVKNAGLLAALFGVVGAANAALPTEATTAITALQTDGGDMLAAGWPVLTAIVGGFILMKLFRKVANKAT